MGLHGVSETAVAKPGVREELQHYRALSLVSSSLYADGPGATGGIPSSLSSTGDDEMRQDGVKYWSVWGSHLLSHLEYTIDKV